MSKQTKVRKNANKHKKYYKNTKKKQYKQNKIKSTTSTNNYPNSKQIESKCIKLFGSKKKSNKFIKQALIKGNKIRTKTKHLRFNYEGYQLLIQNNDIKTNKKLGIKALLNIEFEGNKTAQRTSKNIDNSSDTKIDVSSNTKYPSLYPSKYQYSDKDSILILGEMDFSYALDICHKIGGQNIIATAYYKQTEARKKTLENIKIFKKLNGKQIMFGVDATRLNLGEDMKFDKILFGFPRNSYSPDSQKHNVLFIRKVFEQVRRYLKKDGQFQLLLHVNQSGHSPLEQWKMDYKDWECVHEQIYTQDEMKKMFVLYQSHDGKNNKWMPYRSGLYVFKMT